MPVSLRDIDKTLKELLKPEDFVDFCPNGIQIEGKDEIERIVTGVTASRALVEGGG
jgi:putative NIF3 family GTP cyclohydrolase 1 type 2